MKSQPLRRSLVSGALLALALSAGSTTTAVAFDATALMERYTAAAATQGQEFSYSSITPEGDGFVVSGATWKFPDASPIVAEKLTFSGVSEQGDGTVRVEALIADQIRAAGPDTVVTFDNAAMNGLRIPAEGAEPSLDKMVFYNSFAATGGRVVNKGVEVATFGEWRIALSDFSRTEPMDFEMTLVDSAVDLTQIPDPKFQAVLQQFGYDGKFDLSTTMKGKWDPGSGLLDVPQNDITMAGVGTISLPMQLSGYTADAVLGMQKLAGESTPKDDAKAAEQAMAFFSKVRLNTMSLKFTDDGLTRKGLAFAGQQMQQPPEAVAGAAPFMIGAGMAQLQMPELTAMVQQAVGQFLQNPGTLSVSIAPEGGTGFQELMMKAGNPPEMVKALNVSVVAE